MYVTNNQQQITAPVANRPTRPTDFLIRPFRIAIQHLAKTMHEMIGTSASIIDGIRNQVFIKSNSIAK